MLHCYYNIFYKNCFLQYLNTTVYVVMKENVFLMQMDISDTLSICYFCSPGIFPNIQLD